MQRIEQAAQAALWYKHLRETSNKAFMPLYFDEHRYLVLKGGGGSGKSVFAARKLIERAMHEPGHRFLICRKVGKTLRESCWRNILLQLAEYYPGRYKVNKTDLTITCDNQSVFIFSGLDDVEKLKSIVDIDGIWIEEASETLEGDLNQLDIRMRGESKYYKQIIISFNPVSVMHWLKGRFFDRKDPRAKTSETTYHDNRFLPEEDRQTLEAFKHTDRYYYEVYCLGLWGTTGRTVFDGEAVTKRLLENIQPVAVGRMDFEDDGLSLTKISFVEDRLGGIKIYERPVKGVPYVIGADTAGDGSDSFVAQVLDNRSGRQVAVLRQQYDEDVFAKQLYSLGIYYNTALIGVETNWSTYPVKELERLRYAKQYVRETFDTYTHKAKKSFGFETNTKTRPVIIAELIRAVRDDINIVCDKDTLTEMLTFVRNEQFRPEAEEGAHDDCVMSLAIAHYIRPQQSILAEEEQKKRKWTEDMWEDYQNATPKEREALRKEWGEPR